ncbi:MAG: DNA replication and repair protein RecF [Prevotellaceae bacterium]|jgi:DNA replication and repair protein RecF|nr:DNA replication and repair protein RecF [Prevotellaceae bacterium]
MHLKYLSVSNFKNIEQLDIDCSPILNCFVGNNGEGKTNLLDGIYYLSMCKSKFVASDYVNIRDNENYFMLKAQYFRDNNDENVSCGIKRNGKKSFKYNSKEYKKLSEHIGVIPLVFITPSDTSLINNGSEERRKFLNSVISQTDKQYLDSLIRYNNILMNRNKMLKYRISDIDLSFIDTLSEQMSIYGQMIYEKRKTMLTSFLPVFQEIYDVISGGKDIVSLLYRSDLEKENLKSLLAANLERDCALQYTSVGVHRDDLIMKINGRTLKNSGSQGQQKTYLIAMMMTQFRIIKQHAGISPILLLDDIFDKLDIERVERLISFVTGNGFGQIFLTDSNKSRLDTLLEKTAANYKLFKMNSGNVELLQSSIPCDVANPL